MDDVRSLIEYYLALPKRIIKLEASIKLVSPRYYAAHSFTGGGIQGEFADIQRAISPARALEEIVTDESILSSRIDRARKRLSLLLDEFSQEELERLRRELLADNEVSPFMMRVYDFIQEIEFYMKGHTLGVLPPDEMATVSLGGIEALEDELEEMFSL